MKDELNGALFEQLKFANGVSLIKAVVRTYEQYEADGKKPGSAKYETSTRKVRTEMVADVTLEWCEETGFDDYQFPFNDDYVVTYWIAYRKLGRSEKDKLVAAVGVDHQLAGTV